MKIIRKEKRVFKKGEKYDLDHVYFIFSLFPVDANEPFYSQDDPNEWTLSNDNDGGESVNILRNFTIEFSIKG